MCIFVVLKYWHMYEISKKELENMRMMNNNVLIRIKMFNDLITFSDGTELTLNTDFEPAEHITATGEVYKTPDKLIFDRKAYNSMEWKTEVETQPGDTVYIDYFEVLQALGMKADKAASYPNERWFEVEGWLYIMVPYSALFFAIRGDSIIMLNGYVMAEKVERPIPKSHFLILTAKDVYGDGKHSFGKVLKSGSLITAHKDKRKHDQIPLYEGDMFIYRNGSGQNAEREMHQTYLKGVKYFVLQRWWMPGVIRKEDVKEFKLQMGSIKLS